MKKLFTRFMTVCTALIVLLGGTCAVSTTVTGDLTLTASASSATNVTSSALQEYADEVAILVNEERVAEGLEPLEVLPVLCSLAAERSIETIELFSHDRPDGSSCFTILDGQVDYGAAAENIAAGLTTPESVMDAWMNSEGHRANILTSYYNYIGVGICYDSSAHYGYYWTQIFIYSDTDYADAYTPSNTIVIDFTPDNVLSLNGAKQILAVYAMRAAGVTVDLTTAQETAADVNSDGELNILDAYLILIYYTNNAAGNEMTMAEVLAIYT